MDEDELLREAYAIYGKSWVKIASRVPCRTQRQCRSRFSKLEAKGEIGEGAVAAAGTGDGMNIEGGGGKSEQVAMEVVKDDLVAASPFASPFGGVAIATDGESMFDVDSDAYDNDDDL